MDLTSTAKASAFAKGYGATSRQGGGLNAGQDGRILGELGREGNAGANIVGALEYLGR
jgi:hypothetical protein